MGAEQDLQISQKAFYENFDKLVEFLPDYYVAFIGDKLILFHEDFGVLTKSAYRAFDYRTIFMKKVEAPIEIAPPTVNN